MIKSIFYASDIYSDEARGNSAKNQDSILIAGRRKRINLEDIIYLKSDKNYTIFKMRFGGSIISSKTLKVYEEELKGIANFVRPHRSYLVNLNFVDDLFFNCRGGELLIFDQKISISRRKAADFRRKYRKFLTATGQNVNSTIKLKTKIKLTNKLKI